MTHTLRNVFLLEKKHSPLRHLRRVRETEDAAMKNLLGVSCDDYLEVQVNEEHSFILRQKPLATFSARLSRVLRRVSLRSNLGLPRILLHDFPGGAVALELAARFCYGGGRITISHSNVSVLRCVGEFLEMTEGHARGNLVKLTEMYMQNVGSDWDANLAILRGCDSVLELAEKTHILQRCADNLASRICNTGEDTSSSPLSSSPDSYRLHSGSISRGSFSSGLSRLWWFNDIASLSVLLMERVLKAVIYNDLDNKTVARFLIHYLKSALPVQVYNGVTSGGLQDESLYQNSKKAVLEAVVNLFFHLERGSTSCRFLFTMLRLANKLNAGKPCKRQLEKMIGSQLHEANLDNILLPSYPRTGALYDVDLVVRLVEYFFKEHGRSTLQEPSSGVDTGVETPGSRVGVLIDDYLAEIAPDVNLKVHKFRRLAEALPTWARWTHDDLYRAVDSYIQAHSSHLLDVDVTELCKVIEVGKLSFEACKHAARNPRMPARFVLEVLAFQQGQLRDCFLREKRSRGKERSGTNELTTTTSTKETQLRVDLDEMKFKLVELEKACKSMRSDVTKYNRAVRRLMC